MTVDPRRELWRRGSYEIVGDWLAPASLSALDVVERASGSDLADKRLLDVATGTGTVAIEAARRGAHVTGIDLTDELLDIARRRASEHGVDVHFAWGDFDDLDPVAAGGHFDVVTSSFGVIFSPTPSATLAGLADRLAPDGRLAVVGWDPKGVFVPPASLLDLFPEPPTMPDLSCWTTDIGGLSSDAGCEVVSSSTDDLHVEFASVADAAEQMERWSGGWAQLLEGFDEMGCGAEARHRFEEHLAAFSTPSGHGIALTAGYYASVLRRTTDHELPGSRDGQ